MRVLVIAYHYPPDPAVGSVRPARMVRALREAGHDVTVLTARVHGVEPRSDEPGVVRVRAWPGLRDIYRRMREGLKIDRRRTRGVKAYFDMGRYEIPSQVPAWKRIVSSLMWLPDDLQGFIPPAFFRALRILGGGDDAVVVTTGPPFSVNIVGLLLRSATRARWIVDYRDPWTTGNFLKPYHVRSRFSDAVERRSERRSLAKANAVLAASEGIARLLKEPRRAAPPSAAPGVAVIRNGIDGLAPTAPSAASPVRRITYLGYLYLHRDPRPFLDALAALGQNGQIDLDSIVVDFYGACRWFNNISVEDHVLGLGLESRVRFFDPIDPDECRAVLADSDLLLLLAQKQPIQVPNKLYDYLAVRRPILAFADADGETALMLRQLGGHHIVCDDDPPTIQAVVRAAIAARTPRDAPDAALLEEWSSARQMKRFVELAETVRSRPR